MSKKEVRQRFRDSVFGRDQYRCKSCGYKSTVNTLDAHHVTPREEMPNGGYVAENGISLCPQCHIEAEAYLKGDESKPDFAPVVLYELIGSSYEKAVAASEKLNEG